MNVAGSGVCYLAAFGDIYSLANGAGAYAISHGCPIPASGDTIQLLVVGTTYTCTDVTTGKSLSATDATYPTGNPGILVDQRNSTVYILHRLNVQLLALFVADHRRRLSAASTCTLLGRAGYHTFHARKIRRQREMGGAGYVAQLEDLVRVEMCSQRARCESPPAVMRHSRTGP